MILEASISSIFVNGISGEGEAQFAQSAPTFSAVGSVTE